MVYVLIKDKDIVADISVRGTLPTPASCSVYFHPPGSGRFSRFPIGYALLAVLTGPPTADLPGVTAVSVCQGRWVDQGCGSTLSNQG